MNLHPLKGQVKKGNEVVTAGWLTCTPTDSNDYTVTAQIGADGRFEAFTMRADDKQGKKHPGAPAGTYRVMYGPPGSDQSITPIILPEPFKVEVGSNEWLIDIEVKKKP